MSALGDGEAALGCGEAEGEGPSWSWGAEGPPGGGTPGGLSRRSAPVRVKQSSALESRMAVFLL